MKEAIEIRNSNEELLPYTTHLTQFIVTNKKCWSKFKIGYWLEILSTEQLNELSCTLEQIENRPNKDQDDIAMLLTTIIATESQIQKVRLEQIESGFEKLGLILRFEHFRRNGWMKFTDKASLCDESIEYKITEEGYKFSEQLKNVMH